MVLQGYVAMEAEMLFTVKWRAHTSNANHSL